MEINTGIRLEENPTYGTLRSERRQKDGIRPRRLKPLIRMNTVDSALVWVRTLHSTVCYLLRRDASTS